MLIQITEQDINDGIKCSKCYCPIAKAMNRAYNVGSTSSTVFITIATVWKDNKNIHVNLPKEATEFITNFDCFGKEGVKPITFEVTEKVY